MTEVIRKRWTAGRKKDAVMRRMRGEPGDEVSRGLGVETYRLEKWKDQALTSIELGLKDRQGDTVCEELDKAKRQIGELSMEIGACHQLESPFLRRISAPSAVSSPWTGRFGPALRLRNSSENRSPLGKKGDSN